MGDPRIWLGVILGAGLAWFVVSVIAIGRAGSLNRAFWGLTIAGRANLDSEFEKKVNELLGVSAPVPTPTPTPAPKPAVSPPPPAVSKEPAKPSGEPLRLLTLLQTEARLLDFLLEDISGAGDAQIGSAVRDIHQKAQATLKQHLTLAPVLSGTEGEKVTVPAGFDPSAIRVIGNVTGHPPFTGELQHPGWKVTELKLPATATGQDLFVVQPAEVQV